MRSFPPFVRLALLASLFSVSGVYAQDNIVLKNGSEIQAKVLEVSPGQIKYRRQDNPDGPVYTAGTANVLFIKYANGTKDVLSPLTSRPSGTPLAPLNSTPQASVNSTDNSAPGRLGYQSGLFSHYFTDGASVRIESSVARSLLANHSDAMRAYQHGQSLRRWAYVTAGSAVVLIGAGAAGVLIDDGGFGRNENNRRDGVNNGSTTETDERKGEHGSAEVGLALAGGGVVLGVAAILLNHRATVQFRRAADRYNLHQQSPTSLRIGPSERGLGVGLVYLF